MSTTITLDLSAQHLLATFVQELHDFMASFQLRKPTEADWEHLRQRLVELQARAQATRDLLVAQRASLAPKLVQLNQDLKALSAEFTTRRRAAMKELSATIALQYEDLRRNLQRFPGVAATFDLRKLKPVNYGRNLFHISMGSGAVLAYELLLPHAVCAVLLAALAGTVIFLEAVRGHWPRLNDFLMDRVFKAIARPRERKEINSASWYTVSLTLAFFLLPIRAVEIGVLVLAWADPMASIVGKRWGTRKLYREKSWLGTAAFVATAALVTFAFSALMLPGTPLAWRLGLTATAAATGALAELFSEKLDDNFTILLLVAGVLSIAFF